MRAELKRCALTVCRRRDAARRDRISCVCRHRNDDVVEVDRTCRCRSCKRCRSRCSVVNRIIHVERYFVLKRHSLARSAVRVEREVACRNSVCHITGVRTVICDYHACRHSLDKERHSEFLHVAVFVDEFCNHVDDAAHIIGSEFVITPHESAVRSAFDSAVRASFGCIRLHAACVNVRFANVERNRCRHSRFLIIVRIDVFAFARFCRIHVTDELSERIFRCGCRGLRASVKHLDGDFYLLHADAVDVVVACVLLAVVVLAFVVDDCLRREFTACVRHVDATEVPRNRQGLGLAVCKRECDR